MSSIGSWLSSLFTHSSIATLPSASSQEIPTVVVSEAEEIVFRSPVFVNGFLHEMSGPIALIAQDVRQSRPFSFLILRDHIKDISSQILRNPRIIQSTFEEALDLSDQLAYLQQSCLTIHLEHHSAQLAFSEEQITSLVQLERKASELRKIMLRVEPWETRLNFQNTPYRFRKGLLRNFLANGRSVFAQWKSCRSSSLFLPLHPRPAFNRIPLLWGFAIATSLVAAGIGIYYLSHRK